MGKKSGVEKLKRNAKVFSSLLNRFLVKNEVLLLLLLLFLYFKSDKQHFPEYVISIDEC